MGTPGFSDFEEGEKSGEVKVGKTGLWLALNTQCSVGTSLNHATVLDFKRLIKIPTQSMRKIFPSSQQSMIFDHWFLNIPNVTIIGGRKASKGVHLLLRVFLLSLNN